MSAAPPVRPGFLQGARAGLPVVLGYASIGFACGVIERAAGLSLAEVLFLSLVLYAGSAQLVAVSMLAAGTAPGAIVVSVFLVNLRHLLLSASLAPYLRGIPAWKNALIGAQLTDETFVVAWSRAAAGGALAPAWMYGLNLAAWSTWAVANAAGALLGGAVGDIRALGLDFALPAMFGALLVLMIQGRPDRTTGVVVASTSAALAVAGTAAGLGTGAIVAATLVAATAGLAMHRSRRPS